MFTQWKNEWLVLSTASVTTCNLTIRTKNGGQWLVNWGDGIIELVNNNATKSHTYSSAYVGNVLVRPQSGGLANMDGFQTTSGAWNFDLSVFEKVPNMTYQLALQGNSMALTGNLSSVPGGITNTLSLQGNSMTITGNLSSVPSGLTGYLYLISNLMTITGNLSSLPSGMTGDLILDGNSMTITGNLSSLPSGMNGSLYLSGSLMDVTYTGSRIFKNLLGQIFLRLKTSVLTTTEINNLLIDLDASPLFTGSGTVDLRYNNGAPSGAGLTAKASLIAKGKNVLTN